MIQQSEKMMTDSAFSREAIDDRYQAAVRTAVVAGAFTLVVAALMLYDFARRGEKHPMETTAYKAAILAAREQPDNAAVLEQMRLLDERLRQEYFRQRAFSAVGAVLLAVGAAVCAAAAKAASVLRRSLPAPQTAPGGDLVGQQAQWGRWSVGALGLFLLGVIVGVGLGVSSPLPRLGDGESPSAQNVPADRHGGNGRAASAGQGDQAPGGARASSDMPSPGQATTSGSDLPKPADHTAAPTASVEKKEEFSSEEYLAAWPRFRGPEGTGLSRAAIKAMAFDGAEGVGVVWKTPVPLTGNSSAVVWGKRVFLTGATETKREVYCFDADDGRLLWSQPVEAAPGTPPKVLDATGYAAPTAAVDGHRIYAIFADGSLAAFTLDGQRVWQKQLGIPENSYGHAASLLTFGPLLIVPFDQGHRAAEGKSRLLAFDSLKGEIAWQVVREAPNSWSTPLVASIAGRMQLITAADPWAISYNPADGRELWRAKVLRQDVGPSPTFFADRVYTVSEFPALTAIKADGEGDLTVDKETAKKYLLWKGEDNLPDTASPLAVASWVFILSSNGILTCYDAQSGEMLWDKEFEDSSFSASPAWADDKLFLIDTKGKAWWIEPSESEGKIAIECALGEDCVTSPAWQPGRIYLRGKKHLFCLRAE